MSWPKRKSTLPDSPPLDCDDLGLLGLEPAEHAAAIKLHVPSGFDKHTYGEALLDKLEPIHGRDWKITQVWDNLARLERIEPTLLGRLHTLASKAEGSGHNADEFITVSTWDLSMALRGAAAHHDLSNHTIRWDIADYTSAVSAARTAEQLTCRIMRTGLHEFLDVIRHLENRRLHHDAETSTATNLITKESNMDPATTESAPEPTPGIEPHLEHTITLTGNDYTELLQLVMKYGTGTGAGDRSTSIGLRLALSRPETRVAE